MAATTVLPAPREDAQKDCHGPLRPSRGPNRAGKARTLAIATIFILYIVVIRRRFPPLRSTSDLPDLAIQLVVSFSSISPVFPLDLTL